REEAVMPGQSAKGNQPTHIASPPLAPRGEALRALIIEDSPAYAMLVSEMLAEGLRGRVETIHSSVLSEASEVLLAHPIDVVLLDLSLPDAHKLEALQAVQAAAPDVPIVVLTGAEDPELGLEA